MLVYFAGHNPPKTANCRPNEVEVPDVVGWKLDAARVRLNGQPLTPQLVYKPAKPGQRVDVVLRQFPRTGRLSSFDKVTLVLEEERDIIASLDAHRLDEGSRVMEVVPREHDDGKDRGGCSPGRTSDVPSHEALR